MRFLPLLLSSALILSACDNGLPSDGTSDSFSPGGAAQPLSNNEYQSLSNDEKYTVASKLAGTMFKGISPSDFFDYEADPSGNTLSSIGTNYLRNIRNALTQDLSSAERRRHDAVIDGLDENNAPVEANAKFRFDNDRPRQVPFARITEYPISRDAYIEWMAHILVNTIMYSPAYEMESTNIGDVQNIYRTLVTNLRAGNSVRQIIRSHLPTVARWRVARSAENAALEGFELYLGILEDVEEDVARGGIACQEWYLTDNNDGYQLRRTDFPNQLPQIVLDDYFVTNCEDLFDVISGHPNVMPRAVEVIMNYFMPVYSEADSQRNQQLRADILAENPVTYEDIFTAILFSRAYLLDTERVRSFEESALPTLANFEWDPSQSGLNFGGVNTDIFRRMASDASFFANDRMQLDNMGWSSGEYKIGRPVAVPLDTLSFANYHKIVREQLFRLDAAYNDSLYFNQIIYTDETRATVRPNVSGMNNRQFINYCMRHVLYRHANADEMDYFLAATEGFLQRDSNQFRENDLVQAAVYVFEYASRLPEFYYFKQIN